MRLLASAWFEGQTQGVLWDNMILLDNVQRDMHVGVVRLKVRARVTELKYIVFLPVCPIIRMVGTPVSSKQAASKQQAASKLHQNLEKK